MNMNTIPLMFALIRSALSGEGLSESEREPYTKEMLPELVALARRHDLAHLVIHALDRNGLLDGEEKKLTQEVFKAVYRYENINHEFAHICEALEAAKIVFLPLKGSVIRRYYLEPWMRTSCDIDILVHSEDVDRAVEYLVSAEKFTNKGRGSHDVSLFSQSGVHLELHYCLIEDDRANSAAQILNTIWQYAVKRPESEYHSELTDEMFYYYHIAHMAKHFEIGGCGIRPFIDLWILDNMDRGDQGKCDGLLKQGGLLRFAEVARLLSRVWLDKAEHTEITRQMEQYILSGGVYGTSKNRITVQQQKKGGRLKYALSKIFIPYDVIKFHYPILQKHRWLTPIMEVRRWFKLAFCGHAKRVMSELRYNQSVSSTEAENTQRFLKDIGL